MSGLDHQDWEQYIIHCKTSSKAKNTKKTNKNEYVPSPDKKLNEKVENGELKHKKVDKDLTKNFQKWRQSKNKTQKEVAQLLNVQPQIINNFKVGIINFESKKSGRKLY